MPKSPSSISFNNIVRGKGWGYLRLGIARMAVAGALFTNTLTILSCNMFLFVMIFGLVFLVAGGVGLLVTNTSAVVGSLNWTQGNITFATFTVVGIGMLIFLAIFGSEIE